MLIITEETLRIWRAAGICYTLERTKGGYIVRLR